MNLTAKSPNSLTISQIGKKYVGTPIYKTYINRRSPRTGAWGIRAPIFLSLLYVIITTNWKRKGFETHLVGDDDCDGEISTSRWELCLESLNLVLPAFSILFIFLLDWENRGLDLGMSFGCDWRLWGMKVKVELSENEGEFCWLLRLVKMSVWISNPWIWDNEVNL